MKYLSKIKDYIIRFTKKGLSPHEISLAIALGIFIGFIPVIGTHTVIAIALAYIMRLNILIVLLGSQISNPITIPFQLFLSAEIGNLILHGQLLDIKFSRELNYLSHYLVPILFGGLVLGITVSGLSYIFIKGFLKRREHKKHIK